MENVGDATAYLRISTRITNDMLAGRLTAADADKQLRVISDECERKTGFSTRDAAAREQNPLTRFVTFLETPPDELVKLEAAFLRIDSIHADVKKKCSELVARTRSLQTQARADRAKGLVYVMRNNNAEKAGEILDLQRFHVRFFEIWNDPIANNSLVMAPPGSGKSTCMRWQFASDIGECPELRCLGLYDKQERANDEGMALMAVMEHPRYKALYPNVRIVSTKKMEDEETGGRKAETDERRTKRSMKFTVARKNRMARESTVELVGVGCNVTGMGYERVLGDDFCPPTVRDLPALRTRITNYFRRTILRRLRNPKLARVRIIHTPVHPEDTVGLIRKGIANGEMTNWTMGVDEFAIKIDPKTDLPIPLWDEVNDVAYLQEERFKDPTGFQMNYCLNAAAEGSRAVDQVQFYNVNGDEARSTARDRVLLGVLGKSERWLSVDPSGGGMASTDQGSADIVLTPNGYAFCQEVWFHRMSTPAMLEWIVSTILSAQATGQPYHGFMMESQGGMKGMVDMWADQIPKLLLERGLPENMLPVIVKPNTWYTVGGAHMNLGKWRRLKEASPYIVSGMMRFAGRGWMNRQLTKFHAQGEWQYQAVPGSAMERATELLKVFDGTNKSDVIDAITQWVLFHKTRLHNPFAVQVVREREKPIADPMIFQMQLQMEAMRKRMLAGPDESQSAWEEEDRFLAAQEGAPSWKWH